MKMFKTIPNHIVQAKSLERPWGQKHCNQPTICTYTEQSTCLTAYSTVEIPILSHPSPYLECLVCLCLQRVLIDLDWNFL